MKWLVDITTGIDGTTRDIGRVCGLAAFVVGLSLQIYVVAFRAQPFEFTQFGLGIAAMATGIGAMLRLKQDTEPGAKVTDGTVSTIDTTK